MDTQFGPTTNSNGQHRVGGLRRRTATALTAAGLLAGGLAGGFVVSHAASTTDSSSSSTSTGSAGTGAATTAPSTGTTIPATGGAFKTNEDPTHEAGESAAREAQETAGQMPTIP